MRQESNGWRQRLRYLEAGLAMIGLISLVGCGAGSNSFVVVPAATPVPSTDIPVANAGFDVSAPVGTVVVLDGTGSFDPGGLPLAFLWEQTDGPVAVVLDTPTAPTAGFATLVPGTYVFSLTVDNGIAVSTDTVEVVIF